MDANRVKKLWLLITSCTKCNCLHQGYENHGSQFKQNLPRIKLVLGVHLIIK